MPQKKKETYGLFELAGISPVVSTDVRHLLL
jgi:hypothetical protein